jgi:hypothetical protein
MWYYLKEYQHVHKVLQENPLANKWIPSWILDPYNQDRNVQMLNTDIPSNEAKLVEE